MASWAALLPCRAGRGRGKGKSRCRCPGRTQSPDPHGPRWAPPSRRRGAARSGAAPFPPGRREGAGTRHTPKCHFWCILTTNQQQTLCLNIVCEENTTLPPMLCRFSLHIAPRVWAHRSPQREGEGSLALLPRCVRGLCHVTSVGAKEQFPSYGPNK